MTVGSPDLQVQKSHVKDSAYTPPSRSTASDDSEKALFFKPHFLGGGFKSVLFSPLLGEDFQFD